MVLPKPTSRTQLTQSNQSNPTKLRKTYQSNPTDLEFPHLLVKTSCVTWVYFTNVQVTLG